MNRILVLGTCALENGALGTALEVLEVDLLNDAIFDLRPEGPNHKRAGLTGTRVLYSLYIVLYIVFVLFHCRFISFPLFALGISLPFLA